MKFSIIICTYNRSDILQVALNHLSTQVLGIQNAEVIIVDNNSNDSTKEVAQEFVKKYNWKYILEIEQGLSIARNRGYNEAQNEYLVYLDDDALADKELLLKLKEILQQNSNIKAIGGRYKPWYYYGKPKWYKDHYASKIFHISGTSILKNEHWSGGIMCIEKELLKKAGLFNVELGMNGGKIFYGEETALQKKVRKHGYCSIWKQ